MDPSYSQLMIQSLMGQGNAAPGVGGQNPSTPYGAGFVTGNQSMPAAYGQPGTGAPTQQGSMYGMLGQPAPSTVLQQPMSGYASA